MKIAEHTIDVIIPAYNEAQSIGRVLDDIPRHLVRDIVVCNNGSTDDTAEIALANGAVVVEEARRGYGYACLKGIEYIWSSSGNKLPDIVVFLDGDYSDYPEEMPTLINPIAQDGWEFVIGSRTLGEREKGSLTLPQQFGSWLATGLMNIFFKVSYTDLGPFRAIRFEKLMAMNMKDKTFGWTVEMQIKAAKMHLKTKEVAVKYRRRIGKSKISGTVRGVIMAGFKIIWTIWRHI